MKPFSLELHASKSSFKANGVTLEELFQNAFNALAAIQIDVKEIQKKQGIKIELRATNVEELLHKLLERVLIEQDRKSLILTQLEIESLSEKEVSLKAVAWGEKAPNPSELLQQVRSITWDGFVIKKLKNGYSCNVVVSL